MTATPHPDLSPAEYLALDRASDLRYEYGSGLVLAMSGGTVRHSAMISELARLLGNALDQRPCLVTSNALRLEAVRDRAYFYPDIMVTCGALQYADGHTDRITNPTVIVEVLSDATERWDRIGKFIEYCRVQSLREYVLVSQHELVIERYTRREGDEWLYHVASGPEAVCQFESISVELPLAAISRKATLLTP